VPTVGIERRKHPRYPLVLAVQWLGASPTKDRTEDLSAGGIFIRTDRQFTKGERVGIELSFPGLLDRLRLHVQVMRTRAGGPDGVAGVGVALTGEDGVESQRLQALARAASAVGGSARPYRILLVEDNDLVATMYASALRRLSAREGLPGLQVETVGDGDRALARLEVPPSIDLVITDVYMPVMDGLKLLQRIRQDARLAALPVVVISSGNADEGVRAAALGAQFFLQKPVKYQDIVATVRTLLTAGSRDDLRAALDGP
jgi:CheY-like chemotaxis protein/Tfp pilus assembly protein PilZ